MSKSIEGSIIGAELEHAIGFNGGVQNGLHIIPPQVPLRNMGVLNAQAQNEGRFRFVTATGASAVVNDSKEHDAQFFLRGHTQNISAITLSPSGRLLATGERGYDSDVCVWSLETGSVLWRLQEHDHGITVLSFSDDERLLLTIGSEQDKQVIVWDMATGCIVARSRVEPCPSFCAAWGGFVTDIKGRDTCLYQFATGGLKGISIWALNPITGAMAHEVLTRNSSYSHTRDYLCLAFSPTRTKQWLYGGSSSGNVLILHTSHQHILGSVFVSGGGITSIVTHPCNASGHEERADKYGYNTLDAERDGTSAYVIIGSGDGKVHIYRHIYHMLANQHGGDRRHAGSSLHHDGPEKGIDAIAENTQIGFFPLSVYNIGGVIWSINLCPSIQFPNATGNMQFYPPSGNDKSLSLVAVSNAGTIHHLSVSDMVAKDPDGRYASSIVSGKHIDGRILRDSHATAQDSGEPNAVEVAASSAGGCHPSRGTDAVASSSESPMNPLALRTGTHTSRVTAVSFGRGISDFFASAATDNTVRTWNMSTFECLSTLHLTGAGTPQCLDYIDEFYISGWSDGAVRCYFSPLPTQSSRRRDGPSLLQTNGVGNPYSQSNAHAGTTRNYPHQSSQGTPYLGGYVNDGRENLSQNRAQGSPEIRFLWDIPGAHNASAGGVSTLRLSANRKRLVTGGFDSRIRYWDVTTRNLLCTINEHLTPVSTLYMYKDNQRLLSSSRDTSFIVTDIVTEKRISSHTSAQGTLSALAVSPDESIIYTVGTQNEVHIWDLRQQGPVGRLTANTSNSTQSNTQAESMQFCTVASANNSPFVAAGSLTGTLALWDVRNGGACTTLLTGHSAAVTTLQWTGDDKQVVSGGADGALFVWNVYF